MDDRAVLHLVEGLTRHRNNAAFGPGSAFVFGALCAGWGIEDVAREFLRYIPDVMTMSPVMPGREQGRGV